MSWTNTRKERVKEAWTVDGLSAQQIATELGDVSRNAVISLIHRLGLTGKGERTGGQRWRQRRTKGSPKTNTFINAVAVAHKSEQRKLKPIPLPKPKPTPTSVVPLHVALLDLQPQHCRWPVGEEPFASCGITKQTGSSYCPYHHGIAFVPAVPRRRAA